MSIAPLCMIILLMPLLLLLPSLLFPFAGLFFPFPFYFFFLLTGIFIYIYIYIYSDLVGVLKYSTSRNPPTPSSSSSSSFSPSDSKRIELDPNIFELLGAIVECALLQCQERKDLQVIFISKIQCNFFPLCIKLSLQTAMLFYEVSGNFILKQKVKHKKERKSLEGRGGGEEEPMKYVSSDGDMSDDLSGREGGEGEGERKTAGDFGEESISLRDRFSMSG